MCSLNSKLRSLNVNSVLVLAHIGLYLVVALQALAICVLYYRNTELMKLAMKGGGRGDLVGSLSPKFEALDIRKKNVVNSDDIVSERTNILFVSSDCFVCQKLIDDLSRRSEVLVDRLNSCKLVIYCERSKRGCTRFLAEIDSRILTLIEHQYDVSDLFSIKSPPVLVEIDHLSLRIINITYPFSTDDIFSSLNRSTVWKSGTDE